MNPPHPRRVILRVTAVFLAAALALPPSAHALRVENAGMEESSQRSQLEHRLRSAVPLTAGLEETTLFDEPVDGNLIARDRDDAALLVFQAGEKTLTRLLETLWEKLWKQDPRWQGTFKISHINVLTLRKKDEEVGITQFLESILREPLMNAADSVVGQHYPSLNSMEIRIRAFIQRGELRIEVVDNGLGISSKTLSRLGKRVVSTKKGLDWTRGQSGHGILESTRKASKHGWRFTVTNRSDEANGAVAALVIPLTEPAETPLSGLEENEAFEKIGKVLQDIQNRMFVQMGAIGDSEATVSPVVHSSVGMKWDVELLIGQILSRLRALLPEGEQSANFIKALAQARSLLGRMEKEVLDPWRAQDPISMDLYPKIDDWLAATALRYYRDERQLLHENRRIIAALSPRASALLFGRMGPHLRAEFLQEDVQDDLPDIPILLAGFLPYFQELLSAVERNRSAGVLDPALEQEAQEYAGALWNGLMVPSYEGTVDAYKTYFESLKQELEQRRIQNPEGTLGLTAELFPERIPSEELPRFVLFWNELLSDPEAVEILRYNKNPFKPSPSISLWDLTVGNPVAVPYMEDFSVQPFFGGTDRTSQTAFAGEKMVLIQMTQIYRFLHQRGVEARASSGLEEKRPITSETRRWEAGLDVVTPVNEADLPGFAQWIAWNGAASHLLHQRTYRVAAFDWAAYLNTKGEAVLGFPPGTPVRAIASGRVVKAIQAMAGSGYHGLVEIEHGAPDRGLSSTYVHVVPSVKTGDYVEKGAAIGRLYAESDGTMLVHLHSELANAFPEGSSPYVFQGTGGHWGKGDRYWVDPETTIYSDIPFLRANPQRAFDFRLHGMEREAPIIVSGAKFLEDMQGQDKKEDSLSEVTSSSFRRSGKEGALARARALLKDPALGLSQAERERLVSAFPELAAEIAPVAAGLEEGNWFQLVWEGIKGRLLSSGVTENRKADFIYVPRRDFLKLAGAGIVSSVVPSDVSTVLSGVSNVPLSGEEIGAFLKSYLSPERMRLYKLFGDMVVHPIAQHEAEGPPPDSAVEQGIALWLRRVREQGEFSGGMYMPTLEEIENVERFLTENSPESRNGLNLRLDLALVRLITSYNPSVQSYLAERLPAAARALNGFIEEGDAFLETDPWFQRQLSLIKRERGQANDEERSIARDRTALQQNAKNHIPLSAVILRERGYFSQPLPRPWRAGLEEREIRQTIAMLDEAAPQGEGILVLEAGVLGRAGLEEFVARVGPQLGRRFVLFGKESAAAKEAAARNGIPLVDSDDPADLAFRLAGLEERAGRIGYVGNRRTAELLARILPASMPVTPLDPAATLPDLFRFLGYPASFLGQINASGLEEMLARSRAA